MGERPEFQGEGHPNAKLDDDAVLLIREMCRLFPLHSKRAKVVVKLAEYFNVNPSTVYLAATGESWGHLPGAIGPRPKGKTPSWKEAQRAARWAARAMKQGQGKRARG